MSGHPALRSVRTAPSSRASVTSRFHSATTMPKRMSAADGSGESNLERLWFLVAMLLCRIYFSTLPSSFSASRASIEAGYDVRIRW